MCILFFLIVAIAVLIFPYNCLNGKKLLGLFFINVKPDYCLSYGELGDFIGGVFGGIVGTIIAGIACVYVYKTYISQDKELKIASKTARTEQFESTFFNLIRIHKECLEAIKYTHIYIPEHLPNSPDAGLIQCGLWAKYEDGDLTEEEYRRNFKEEPLQGEMAMYEEFKNPRINRMKVLSKYYHLVWLNDIRLIVTYLKKNNNKKFYEDFFYSQITRPEWWIMYGIFLYGDKFATDKTAYNKYVRFVRKNKLFNNGFDYISEEYNVTIDNLYDKSINHNKHRLL